MMLFMVLNRCLFLNMTINLSKEKRFADIELPFATKKASIKVSRSKCNDILVEMVDVDGMATSKPLHKILPEIKSKKQLIKLRFIMNDFSTKPIAITIEL